MIELKHVSFAYQGQEHDGLHDINLTIADGECVLFCGRSGCGKTTITRLVNGLIPQFYAGELMGSVLVDGQEISKLPMYQIAAKVGSVFQNPRTQFFNVDTDSEIAFGIENEARPPVELAERVEQATDDLHIRPLRNRNIFELSGGEKQKIAFASVYGGTETAAALLAARLREKGVPVAMYDVSVTHPSYVLSEAFKYSHLVFASTTYNNGIFVTMETLLHDIAAHCLKNRTVALIQNGSWAPASGKLMRGLLEKLEGFRILDGMVTLKSALAPGQEKELEELAQTLCDDIHGVKAEEKQESAPRKGFVCTVCGFIYEGDTMPEGFVCPICRRPASAFKPLE